MKPEERPEGNCGICDQPRIKLSNGVWACPNMWLSPMHNCIPLNFREYDDEFNEINDGVAEATKRLEDYAGCSLENYLKDRAEYYQSF